MHRHVEGGIDGIAILAKVAHELTLFAAVGILVGGLSDLVVDVVWLGRAIWRRLTVYRVHPRANAQSLLPHMPPRRFAVFVPAWDEHGVIGPMLRHAAAAWVGHDYTIFVGTYPNDPATRACAGAAGNDNIEVVVGGHFGPTTKADCLNTLWRAMVADEAQSGRRYAAVVLHDAEDVVHRSELAVFDALIGRFDLVQLPVFPIVDCGSRWVAGHYIDEFTTHHARLIVARETIGAGLPSAGVGCAFERDMIGRLVIGQSGPFDADSLTEDYELGLRIRRAGGRSAFVRIRETPDGPLVGVHSHFPGTIGTAVTQKARWIAGIALSGWDRLGWAGGLAEVWMRLNDRRAPFAALILLAAYLALIFDAGLLVAIWSGAGVEPPSPLFQKLLALCGLLMVWRLAIRSLLVARGYGWREGLRAVPRAFVANLIDMMAARRAVGIYLRARRRGHVEWDKTAHRFPGVSA